MASNSRFPSIRERDILQSYLLPPAPLPTILPYSAFLNLVPKTYRNDPDCSSVLKRLYRDLQFERSIAIEQVRQDIERECGARSITMKANLAKRIAIEEGNQWMKAEQTVMLRKRKRGIVNYDQARPNEEAMNESEPQIKDEDLSSSEDEFTNPLSLAAHKTLYDDPSNLHPAAGVLPLSSDLTGERIKHGSDSNFHTKESLLAALRNANHSLERESEELDAECIRLKEELADIVGGLSDLRYGKRHSEGESSAEGYRDVLEALDQFKGVLAVKRGVIAD